MQYIGMHLTKKVKDLSSENSKTLMEKKKVTQGNRTTFYFHGLEEQILLTSPYYITKQSTVLKECLSQYQQHFSHN